MQHFYDSGHSFAKIAIPYTIYPSLNSSGFLPSFLYSRDIYIVSVSSNFPVPKGHDANFAWNQYETAIKFVRE